MALTASVKRVGLPGADFVGFEHAPGTLVSALARQGVDVASMLGMPVEEAFTRLHGAEAGAEAHELA